MDVERRMEVDVDVERMMEVDVDVEKMMEEETMAEVIHSYHGFGQSNRKVAYSYTPHRPGPVAVWNPCNRSTRGAYPFVV